MTLPLASLWPLLLLPVAWRLLPGGRRDPEDWDWKLDPLLLVLTTAIATATVAWGTHYYMPRDILTASDFPEYCSAVLSVRDQIPEIWSGNRSRFAAALPAFWAGKTGILDAFALAGLTCAALICGSLFLWGRALHSRLAGILAAIFCISVAPLVLQSRTVGFYPEVAASLSLAAAATALAMRFRNAWTCGLAGAAIGLALLVDLRNLMWAVPYVGLTFLAALRWPRRQALTSLAALFVPLLVSWNLGPVAFPDGTTAFEHQVNLQLRYHEMGVDDPRYLPPYRLSPTRYIWGQTPFTDIPRTLLWLQQQGDLVPEYSAVLPFEHRGGGIIVRHWIPLAMVSLLVCLWGLRKKPLLLFGLGGTSLPFLLAFNNAIMVSRAVPRFLGYAMPFVPLLLGVAFAVLAQGKAGTGEKPWTHRNRAWFGGVVLCVFLVATGVVPSGLSPAASWRPYDARPDGSRDMKYYLSEASGLDMGTVEGPKALSEACAAALEEEVAAGGPHRVRFDTADLGAWTPTPNQVRP